jgi:hypothetical protein
MNLLIDTNIVIPMEPGSYVDTEINTGSALEFHNLALRSGSILFVHKAIHYDLNRDKNTSRADMRRLLINKYSLLDSPSTGSFTFPEIGDPHIGSNDWVDNQLLIALEADLVDYLVSEDVGVHTKARRFGVEDRLLFLNDAIILLREIFDVSPPPLPEVEFVHVYDINNSDQIFDSLRQHYPDFDQWFIKCKREQRQAFVIYESEEIAGITILKRENQLPNGHEGKVLKLCTLKVGDNYSGQRYGELLLKSIFHYVNANKYDYTYFTVYPKYSKLNEFATDFGFYQINNLHSQVELAYIKRFKPTAEELNNLSALELHKQFGPKLTSFSNNSSFLVPIRPIFHQALFPEAETQQMLFRNLPCGNSIKKAYLSHSKSNSIQEGDNIFFYRSHDYQSVTGLGIVDGVIKSNRPNEIARYVGTRTVYSYSQIESMCEKAVLAIKFRQVDLFDKPIELSEMVSDHVFSGAPQSIMALNQERVKWLTERIAL